MSTVRVQRVAVFYSIILPIAPLPWIPSSFWGPVWAFFFILGFGFFPLDFRPFRFGGVLGSFWE